MARSRCAICLPAEDSLLVACERSGASDGVAVQQCRWHPALRSAGRSASVDVLPADAQQDGVRAQPSAAAELPAVLAQIYALGAGLVQDVLLSGSQTAPA